MSDKQPHHGFLDSLKSMVVDETPDTTHASTPAAPAPAAPAASPFNFSFSSAPAASAGTSAPSGGAPSISSFVNATPVAGPEADGFYQKLAAQTDFEQTPVAATLHKYLDS